MNIYLKLILTYLKLGLFGFGGGYAMLSLIQQEVVQRHGWISFTEFTDIVAISQMTPGPIGINSATYIGYTVTGGTVIGAIAATVAVVVPPYILMLYASHFVHKHRESPIIKGVFMGLRPVMVGLIASAALLLMNSDNFGSEMSECIKSILICVITFFFCLFYQGSSDFADNRGWIYWLFYILIDCNGLQRIT